MNWFAMLLLLFAAVNTHAVDYCRIDIAPADNLFVIIYDHTKEDFVQCYDDHISLYETIEGVFVNDYLVIRRLSSPYSQTTLEVYSQHPEIVNLMASGKDLESAIAHYIEKRSIIMNVLTEFVVDNMASLGVTKTVERLNAMIDVMDAERTYLIEVRPDERYKNSVIVITSTQRLQEKQLGSELVGITIDDTSIPRSRDTARPVELERPLLDCRQIEPLISKATSGPPDDKLRCIVVGGIWSITPLVFPDEEAMWRSIRRGW